MNIFNDFRKQIIDVIEGLGDDSILPEGLNLSRVAVDVPRDAAYGDLSTNAAMVLAKTAGMRPRDMAQLIVDKLAGAKAVSTAEIAGPGFINIRRHDTKR